MNLLVVHSETDVSIPSPKGIYPIHFACKYKLKDTLRLLINRHVDVNILNQENQTPLHVCSSMEWSDGVTILSNAGAVDEITEENQLN